MRATLWKAGLAAVLVAGAIVGTRAWSERPAATAREAQARVVGILLEREGDRRCLPVAEVARLLGE